MKMAAHQSADSPSALLEAEQVLEATRRRVLKLLYERGEVDRNTLYMLLALKSDTCWRITGIAERETDFVITVSLPGADPELSDLTVEPRQLVITAKPATYQLAATLSGRLGLPIDLQSEKVQASLHRGALVVIAPKAAV
jgi:HSP20 family molecular chaperone IbpA